MSTKQEVGGYRDAHLEAEELVRRAGPVLESFVQERILLDGPRFKQVGPDLRDLLTGKTIEEFYDPVEMRKKWPHGFADWMPDTEEQISWATIENACLRPSPKHVAELFKLVGEKCAREIMAQWGADPVKMLPGVRPGYAEHADKLNKNKAADEEGARNPFNPKAKFDEAERIEKIATYIGKLTVCTDRWQELFDAADEATDAGEPFMLTHEMLAVLWPFNGKHIMDEAS